MITPLSRYLFDLFATGKDDTLEKILAKRADKIEKLIQELVSAGTLYCGKCPDRLTKVQVVWCNIATKPFLLVRILGNKELHRRHKSLLCHEVGVDISEVKK